MYQTKSDKQEKDYPAKQQHHIQQQQQKERSPQQQQRYKYQQYQQQQQQQLKNSNIKTTTTKKPKHKCTYPTMNKFIKTTQKLLNNQLQQQKLAFQQLTDNKTKQQIQEEGAGLANMLVINTKDGLYGKIIITIVKSFSSQKNPINIPQLCKLQVGDDVAIYHNNTMIDSGVIYKRMNHKIKIAIRIKQQDQNQDYQGFKVNIVLKWNQTTYKRYFSVLRVLADPQSDQNQLTRILFQETSYGYKPKKIEPKGQEFSPKMNSKQNQAIANSLVQRCHLIHGPPGTGKTTTVCQLIVQAVKKGDKVLACAPSNIAVDNIVEGVVANSSKVKCVRIGSTTRIIPEILNQCLDFLVDAKSSTWKAQQKKLTSINKKIKRAQKYQKRQLYKQVKMLRKQLTGLQQQVIQQILMDADVICCTNAGAADRVFKKYLNKRKFDLVVIDQCGQGLQVSCWIPLLRGKRAVLAGDHKQLPPTVKFQKQSLLSYTLFSRAMQQLQYVSSTMLQVQYRMNKQIMGWSNLMFYGNKLQAHSSVENHQLREIYNSVDEQETSLMFMDTAGCLMGEEGDINQSKMNIGQADLIVYICKKIMSYNVKPKDIAILTPYSKQVTLIKNLLLQKVSQNTLELPQVSTVDGIQGRQKQCILISLVRSNPEKQVGFLKDWRRMNVAVTRARRMLMIVGDSDTIAADSKIASLIQWVGQHGSLQSAEQLRDFDGQIRFGRGKISTPFSKQNKQDSQKHPKTKQHEKQQKKNKKSKNLKQPKKKSETTQKNINNLVNYNKHSQQQKQVKYVEYKKLLQSIQNSKQKQLILDNLSAFERMIVHEVADGLNYQHFTSQDKLKLTVRIKKQKQQEIQEVKQQQNQEQQQEKKEVKNGKGKKNKKNKNKEKKKQQNKKEINVPSTLAELIGNQSSEQQQKIQKQQIIPSDNINKDQVKLTKKQKNKQKQKNAQKKEEEQQDWQKLLEEFENELPKNDQCYKCNKKITSVTSIKCKFCQRYFCRHDVLAEEHGCEDQARHEAKKGKIDKFIEQGTQKINQKIREQEQKRQRKNKDTENNKKK